MTIEECLKRKDIYTRLLKEWDENKSFYAETEEERECVTLALRRSFAIEELNIAELSKKEITFND